MKFCTVGLYLLTVSCLVSASTIADAKVAPAVDVEVFVRSGCPYCDEAKLFLADLQQQRPALRVRIRDISQDPQALRDLHALAERFGVRPIAVPAFCVRNRVIVGFLSVETTGKAIESLLDQPAPAHETVEVPFLGRLGVRELGLPLFTIILGLLDGFNPCAMWVLLFLLSMLVNLHDRKKMIMIGGSFVAVSGFVYFAFMAAWLNLFFLIGVSRITQILLGTIAALIGVLNVKDFLALGSGLSVGIPKAAKPGIYRQVRRIIQAENLGGAFAAVVFLAILVNTMELLCTGGFPAIYTRVLTLYSLPTWSYYGYLALYNVAYIADDSLVLTIAVVTLSRHKLQEKGGRWLKLLGGAIMLALGLLLMLRPKWFAF
ncbi:MAG: NrdH-redoxin [Deltaproteobacteria bacterium]|nr:NrdH-redoxin [Deltaproteobacteria bacterium]